ncbi:MAG: nitrilase-related carbon-nitrogen hydrolase [Microthrixaceae bacterium]
MPTLRVALGQMNPHVGNLAGNVARLAELYGQAELAGCDLVAFPELAVPGYPSEDLLIRRGFLEDNVEALDRLVAHRPLRRPLRLRRRPPGGRLGGRHPHRQHGGRGVARGRPRPLPEAAPAQLRRVRRGPLLHRGA